MILKRMTIQSNNNSYQLPPFSPAVLKPRLNLGVRHLESLGQGAALRRRQVLLAVEALLKLEDLEAGK
ncbi:hypothetical protein DPMN_164718 [Dreissena polymorpha]|uniref:Uncharacterized protein n=1 Tax=Dreissena polymorpha TaxID=45954 RepID=A0A9D4EYB3_DREPO|nr:hypothetical protein DPMN_164718 [Dreissena polymorpha]